MDLLGAPAARGPSGEVGLPKPHTKDLASPFPGISFLDDSGTSGKQAGLPVLEPYTTGRESD